MCVRPPNDNQTCTCTRFLCSDTKTHGTELNLLCPLTDYSAFVPCSVCNVTTMYVFDVRQSFVAV